MERVQKRKKKRDFTMKKKQSDLAKKEGWVYTSNYQFKKEMTEKNLEKPKSFHDQNKVSCDYCEKNYTKQSLLKHIGKNEDCKTHYGARFDELKRERDRERKKVERCNKIWNVSNFTCN